MLRTDFTIPALKPEKPRYLMGVDVRECRRGSARHRMFDCVMPTRSGRTGQPSRVVALSISTMRDLDDPRPLTNVAAASLYKHSRAYLHHLSEAKECLAQSFSHAQYAVLSRLMRDLRRAIEAKNLEILLLLREEQAREILIIHEQIFRSEFALCFILPPHSRRNGQHVAYANPRFPLAQRRGQHARGPGLRYLSNGFIRSAVCPSRSRRNTISAARRDPEGTEGWISKTK